MCPLYANTCLHSVYKRKTTLSIPKTEKFYENGKNLRIYEKIRSFSMIFALFHSIQHIKCSIHAPKQQNLPQITPFFKIKCKNLPLNEKNPQNYTVFCQETAKISPEHTISVSFIRAHLSSHSGFHHLHIAVTRNII